MTPAAPSDDAVRTLAAEVLARSEYAKYRTLESDLVRNVLEWIARLLAWLDGLPHGGDFICGKRFTLADVFLFAFLDFGTAVGQTLDPSLEWLPGWFARVAARPSAAATK